MERDLKIREFRKKRGWSSYVVKSKVLRAADQVLWFRVCKKQVFSYDAAQIICSLCKTNLSHNGQSVALNLHTGDSFWPI